MELLHSKIIGNGAPLIILHGYFGNGDNWKTIANELAKTFEVHLVDQRNHGRSFHADVFDYEEMVKDLQHYITHYQLEQLILIGHSMGGKVAMLYATDYPESVRGLIVADISPKMYPPHHHDILDALNSIDFSIHSSRKLVDEKLKEFIPEVGVRQFLMKNIYWKEKGQLDFRFNVQSLTENTHEVGAALPSFNVFEGSTLFLKGENSGYISTDDTSLIKAHFPAANILVIPKAGHWLHAENPVAFLQETLLFLAGFNPSR